MKSKILGVLSVFVLFLSLSSAGYSAETEIRKLYIEAYDAKDAAKMAKVIEENKDKIPSEIKSLLDDAVAPGTGETDRESNFYMAELMANGYKDLTGDVNPLKDVKKAVFSSKLTPSVRPEPLSGVIIVEMPEPTDAAKNVFRPDNIIIKKGMTVRWVNSDNTAHVLASMRVIGMGGLFSPSIEPGKSWDYRFEKPGEYYYICFIHKAMVGKVTVEE